MHQQLWYIIHNKHHFGPYSISDVRQLYHDKKILHQMQLWNSKCKEPLSFYSIEAKKILGIVPESVQLHYKTYKRAITLNNWAKRKKHGPFHKFQKNEKPILFLLSVLFSVLIFQLTSTDEIKSSLDKAPHRPSMVSLKDYQEMEKWWDSTVDKVDKKVSHPQKNDFFWLGSKDGKQFWIANKFQLPIKTVELQSVEGKVLSSQKKWQHKWNIQEISNKIESELTSLKLPEKTVFPHGLYNLKITYYNDRPQSLSPLFEQRDREENNVSSEIILGPWTKDELEKKLKSDKHFKTHKHAPKILTNKKIMEQKAPPQIDPIVFSKNSMEKMELQQKYQTILSIVAQLQEFWLDVQKQKPEKRQSKITQFKSIYAAQYGSFFTSMVLENEQLLKKWGQSSAHLRPALIAHLSFLDQLAKDSGQLAMDIIQGQISNSSVKSKFKNLEYRALENLELLQL